MPCYLPCCTKRIRAHTLWNSNFTVIQDTATCDRLKLCVSLFTLSLQYRTIHAIVHAVAVYHSTLRHWLSLARVEIVHTRCRILAASPWTFTAGHRFRQLAPVSRSLIVLQQEPSDWTSLPINSKSLTDRFCLDCAVKSSHLTWRCQRTKMENSAPLPLFWHYFYWRYMPYKNAFGTPFI